VTQFVDPFDLIVIPARFGSSRFPGKPLQQIAGRSLLERVIKIAQIAAEQAGSCKIVVATDDDRIAEHASGIEVAVAMTSPDINSGTNRAFAAACQLPAPPARIVNLQGDAPFIPANIVVELLQTLRNSAADVVTPLFRLDWERLDRLREHKCTAPFSGTTCIRSAEGKALWFSKSIIPAIRDEANLRTDPMSPVWQHLGLYGYSYAALQWFASAPAGIYERLEGLEQLRFLENGRPIDTIEVEVPAHILSGIDTPEDLAKAEEAIRRYGDPYPA
jgi:3-deoxy-manno-octulosonate cytidylyltransferase (CMP-KDO synthetase)